MLLDDVVQNVGNGGINGLTLAATADLLKSWGEPAFRARQLFAWLHKDNCTDFGAMTNLPASLREKLAEKCVIDAPEVVQRQASQDGTVKMLLHLRDGNHVETVLMKYNHGYSVCVSSQVGCPMGCAFCASAKGGLVRNLHTSEIVAQLAAAEREAGGRVGHVVLMGIGEPMDNYQNVLGFLRVVADPAGRDLSMRNISLSTCGVVPSIWQLAKEDLSLTLSISLHAANNEVRSRLMPVNRKWPLDVLMDACKGYRKATGRRVSFEYAMFRGVNDSDEDARALADLLAGTDAHVNLIPANPVEGLGFEASGSKRTGAFQQMLQDRGMQVTVRRRLGTDIDAACGQLRMRQKDEPK